MTNICNTLALSGWAQPYNALQVFAPGAQHVSYGNTTSWDGIDELLLTYGQVELAIGWSLGGAILMNAVARGVIHPKKLVLLCAPVQFVADEQFSHAMGATTFAFFKENFLNDPHKTATKFHHLIAKGDEHYGNIVAALRHTPVQQYDPWKNWINILGMLHHTDIDYCRLPPTLLVYGEKDHIVSSAQGEYLQQHIPDSELHIVNGCAHAPHLHDTAKLRAMTERFIRKA